MGVVIDTCCLAKVFDPGNTEHFRFAPVWDWINVGNGRMIYGGTKYLAELSQMVRFLRLMTDLSRRGRVIVLPKENVDEIEDKVKRKVGDGSFNDEHLVAIVIASGCRVICTDDHKAMPYLKRADLYADYDLKRPFIYTNQNHGRVCCDKYLPRVCKQSSRHGKSKRKDRKR